MAEKYLMFSLDDEKAKKLGEIISNQTARKIVSLLAEKELSESELAKMLNLPLNTAEYNIKKLLEAGIIEKSKNFFWSVRGKKIENYKLANKLIVISPKKAGVYGKLKGIAPAVLISGILAFFAYLYYKPAEYLERVADIETPMLAAEKSAEIVGSYWLWFLAGSLIVALIFLIWNWKKL